MKSLKGIFVVLLFISASTLLKSQKIVGYIPQYRTTDWMDGAVEWDKMTDYYYFGSLPTSNGGITIEQSTRFQHVINRANEYNKNVWLSIGGWGKSGNFISVANNPTYRQDFADEALSLCQTYGLTGIDIDWEFPAYGQEEAFRDFFKTLYETLNPEGYLVSAAAGGESSHADKWLAETFNYIDDLNIMSYDAPAGYSNHASLQFMKDAMTLYENQGCPYSKMLGGVAFYGRCAGEAMYSGILNSTSDKQACYENDNSGGYCYNGKNTITDKIDYVMGQGGIGILIWEVTQDVLGQYSLLNACDIAMDPYRCFAPTPDLGSDVSICGLSSVTLDGGVAQQSGVTFTWKKGAVTLVDQSPTANTLNATSSGVYTLEVWKDGCNRSDEIEVTGVLNTPDLGGPYELCDPVSVTLDAGVAGAGGTIEWQLNNQPIYGENESTLNVTKGGTYKVTVSATGCSSVNASVIIDSEVPYAEADTICASGEEAEIVANETVKWYTSETDPSEILTDAIFTPTVNSNTTYWMGGAGSALTEYTTLKTQAISGWGASTSNYGNKITVLSEISITGITVKPIAAGTLKMNLKASNGSTILKTTSFSVNAGEQDIVLSWQGIAPGVYFIDAEGSSMSLTIDGTAAANDFEVTGVLTSEKHCYEKWGGGYSASTNYGFFTKLKILAGKECKRVPVNVVIDASNPGCLSVGSQQAIGSDLKVYPNPSNSEFSISNYEGVLNIYDVKGALVKTQNLTGGVSTFGKDLEKGVYFIQVNNDSGFQTMKVVKK